MPRRRRRRQPSRQTKVVTTTTPERVVVERTVAPRRRGKDGRRRKRGAGKQGRIIASTPAGRSFLQCTIAPFDFSGNTMEGVPDQYTGKSTRLRHRLRGTLTLGTGTNYLLFAPTPGVAYWYANGGDYTPRPFTDFNSVFPNASATPNYGTDNVTEFRYVSMAVSIKNVSAILNSAGCITAGRVGISFVRNAAGDTYIKGLGAITPTALGASGGTYNGHVNQGVYGQTFNDSGSWDFSPIAFMNGTNGTGEPGLVGNFMGWGNMRCMGITIDGANASTVISIAVECCVEYVPRPGSLVEESSTPSAMYDPVALAAYQFACRNLPAFVPAHENAGFWERFMSLFNGATGLLSALPGTSGKVFSAIHGISTGLSSLFIGQ